MESIELKKGNGDVFFTAQRAADNSYILVNWIGIQSLESVMYGAGKLSAMLQRLPCQIILNSNKELIGPWEEGALFLANIWAPKAKNLGLKKFAQVLAPGIYGRRSFEKFKHVAQANFQIETFEDETAAKLWVLKQ